MYFKNYAEVIAIKSKCDSGVPSGPSKKENITGNRPLFMLKQPYQFIRSTSVLLFNSSESKIFKLFFFKNKNY